MSATLLAKDDSTRRRGALTRRTWGREPMDRRTGVRDREGMKCKSQTLKTPSQRLGTEACA
jgi:hypothetical protein